MNLYSIKNTQTGFYNPPFVARDCADAEETVRKAIIGGRDLSLLVELENLELHEVGTFGAYDAEFETHNYTVCALSTIKLPDHIQKIIDKMKGENEDCSSH